MVKQEFSDESTGGDAEQIPSPRGLPLVGNIRSFKDSPLEFFVETAQEHGPVAQFQIGRREFIQLSDPEYIEHVLIHNNDAYAKGREFQDVLKPIVGNGLITTDGDYWRSQRHMIEPAFHPDEIKRYSTVVTDIVERHCKQWADGEVRDIQDEMLSLTTEIIAKTLFDIDIREQREEIADSLDTVMSYSAIQMRRPIEIPSWVPTPGNRKFERAIEDLHAVADRIIDQHKANSIDGTNIVSVLQEAEDSLSREDIRNQVLSFLIAGYETTQLGLTYILQLLSKHPQKLHRLQSELTDVLGGNAPTMADLHELTYMEKVMKEGLRIYPPIPGTTREATEDDEIDGYHIPAGTVVTFQQWVLHRDPRYFDEPEAFRPERWSKGFEKKLPPFAYFPFGGGPHRCIGERFAKMEICLILGTILQEWEFETTLDELSFAPSITNRHDGPVEMVLRRR
ncbi:cytochrome P450 (plasmid) [Haloferax sp. S1W]|uniref:cytochrome P450 n=1 Tax=Haloferax sp. S1W TaxID=3377110 RepID=UPI0037C5C5D0